ncbi:MAG: hypothetical protein ABR613_13300 [Actinomycetota bacterium]
MATAAGAWILGGLFSPLPSSVRVGAVVAVGVAAIARDLSILKIALPQNARQVPQEIFRKPLLRAALQFGFEMGTGLRTFVTSTSPYALLVALLLLGPTGAEAVAAGAGFGVGRAAMLFSRRLAPDPGAWGAGLHRVLRGVVPVSSVAVVMMSVAMAAWWPAP